MTHTDPRDAFDVADDDLLALRAPDAAPRRSDAAFARAVRDDIVARRQRAPLVPGLVVAGAAAVAIVVGMRGPADPAVPPGIPLALLEAEAGSVAEADVDVDALDDETLLAIVDGERASAEATHFAFGALDGSTDEELDALERALDRALARKL